MVQVGRTFRIFVSSTFSDLKEERNALQKYVFPRLRELCMQHGCRFQAIDLRWGVSEEAGLDQQTMRICFEEIARCQKTSPKPNFIILLGDRYGWQPVPSEIPADEFEKILEQVTLEDRSFLLWDEKQDDQNKGWYRKDENSVPPVYCLQPRTDDYVKYSNWEKAESQLREILRSAVEKTDLNKKACFKYYASATEQEISQGALELPKYMPNAKDHVFGFFRSIDNLDEVKREAKVQPDRSSLPENENEIPLPADFIDTTEKHDFDASSHQKLIDLKERLSKLLDSNIKSYKSHWDGKSLTQDHIGTLPEDVLERMKQGESIGDPNTLCVAVWNNLHGLIKSEIDKIESLNPLDQEINAHEKFRNERNRFFVGRKGQLNKIEESISNFQYTIVHGESGTGKSALMAKAIEIAELNHRNAKIIYRFIGVTPLSSDPRSLLEGLCHEIAREYGEDEEAIPSDYKSLVIKFPEILALATSGEPLILFLDALDQFQKGEDFQIPEWLPSQLPDNAHIVVSTFPGQDLNLFKKRIISVIPVEVKGMDPSEGVKLLDLWLNDAGRKFQSEQQKEVINKFNLHGLPLYLKMAFEEARRWRSYTAKPDLKSDIPGIIQDLFTRLSSKENHGALMVSRSLGYLAASKNGLSEDEVIDILSRDDKLFDDFIKRTYHAPPEKKLPVIVWSQLYFDLEPYLTERSADGTTVLSFYHRQFREVVKSEFLKDSNKVERHCSLARYFDEQPLFIGLNKSPNIRKVSELPYQQTFGELWGDLERTLTDLMFIQAKFTTGMGYDLIADYNRVTKRNNAGPPIITASYYEGKYGIFCPLCHAWNKIEKDILGKTLDCPECRNRLVLNTFTINAEWYPSIRESKTQKKVYLEPQLSKTFYDYSDFVFGDLHVLLKRPELTIQQALNQPDLSRVAIKAKALDYRGSWIRWINKPQKKSSCRMTLEGHTSPVKDCSFSPDGKKIVSTSEDRTLRIWDAETGKLIKVLEGHTDGVTSCSFSPDGKKIASASVDETLRIWDVETGESIKVLEGHTDRVTSCSFSPDGKKIASASVDETLRIWDAETGKVIKCIWVNDYVYCCSFSPDGKRIVSASQDRYWSGGNHLCAFSPDSRAILSESNDIVLCIWDAETGELATAPSKKSDLILHNLTIFDSNNGEEIKSLETSINSCSFSPDSKRIVSSSTFDTLLIWDTETGESIKELKGHTDSVWACSFSPDGRRIVSASEDKTLRIWDAETGESNAESNVQEEIDDVFFPHLGEVVACSFFSDGKKIVTVTPSGNFGSYIYFLDAETGEIVKCDNVNHSKFISSISLSPDGKRIVSVSSDSKDLRIWDVETGESINILKGHTSTAKDCSFSPDGKRIVSASVDETLRIWDAETGESIKVLQGHTDMVISCSFSPDGKRIISSSKDKTLHIWDAETGESIKVLKGHINSVWACSFSPDGKRIVSASKDKTLHIWDAETGESIKVLQGHTDAVISCSFSPDGKKIVSASFDKTLHIWDVETGSILYAFYAYGALNCLDVEKEQKKIVIGDKGGNEYILLLNEINPYISHIKPTRLYYNELHYWNSNLKLRCKLCGNSFSVEQTIVNKISLLNENLRAFSDGHKISLKEFPDDPLLVIMCPHCKNKLKITQFIVGSAEKHVNGEFLTGIRKKKRARRSPNNKSRFKPHFDDNTEKHLNKITLRDDEEDGILILADSKNNNSGNVPSSMENDEQNSFFKISEEIKDQDRESLKRIPELLDNTDLAISKSGDIKTKDELPKTKNENIPKSKKPWWKFW